MDKVRAIFISHEHGDHIAGISVLAKKFRLPVYITNATLRHGGLNIDQAYISPFVAHQPVQIGSLTITAFPKYHDASDPHSFVISCSDVTVGVFTDIGIACEQVTRYFRLCHAAFLEANYDEEMLENGGYPYHLKRRIRGGHGHLSNAQALELFRSHRPAYMTHLLLSHLSRNNNHPDIVQALFNAHALHTKIIIAGRYRETPVYHITNNGIVNMPVSLPIMKKRVVKDTRFQLSLFQ